jgi:DNA polymerase III delta subunit
MQVFELNKRIVEGTVPKFLIFTGTEYAVINLYIQQISRKQNVTVESINNVGQIIQKRKIVQFLSENKLYVCRYDTEFQRNEESWVGIDDKLGNNYLVLILQSVDSRTKFSKKFSERVVEFNAFDEDTNVRMLSSISNLTEKNLREIVKNCDQSYSRSVLEIQKVTEYANVKKLTHNESYLILRDNGVMLESSNVTLQEFVDSVMYAQDDCLSIYKKLCESGESNLTMLAWLYNAFRAQLCYETVSKPTCENTGLIYPVFMSCKDRSGVYSTKELVNALEMCKQCEQGIKQGLIAEQQVVETLLINVL